MGKHASRIQKLARKTLCHKSPENSKYDIFKLARKTIKYLYSIKFHFKDIFIKLLNYFI